MKLTAELDSTRVIHVMDREGDFFELFAAWRDGGRDELVVRAKNDRRTNSATSLFRTVLAAEVKASLTVDIPRKSARRKKGRNNAQPRRQKRRATLQLRYCPVSILPPKHGLSSKPPPVDAFIVHVKEQAPPAEGSKAVEWFLLTTLAVDSPETAEKVFRHYVKRWRIEDWRRALKTCCGAEEPAHRNAERLKRLLAINMVLAWRVLVMMMLGREMPELPPGVLFADDQIEVLKLLPRKWRCPKPKYLQITIAITAKAIELARVMIVAPRNILIKLFGCRLSPSKNNKNIIPTPDMSLIVAVFGISLSPQGPTIAPKTIYATNKDCLVYKAAVANTDAPKKITKNAKIMVL